MAGRPTKPSASLKWLWWTGGVIGALSVLAVLAWLWVVPMVLDRVTQSMVSGLQRISGAAVTCGKASLVGLGQVTIRDLQVTSNGHPLMNIPVLVARVDVLAIREGLPTVMGIQADGVQVTVVRDEDGNDNLTPVLRSVRDYLNRERTGDAPATLFARLLRQTPPVTMNQLGVTFQRRLPGNSDWIRELELVDGRVVAANPGITSWERGYVVEARFYEKIRDVQLQLDVDADIDRRIVQGVVHCQPPLALTYDGSSAEIKEVRFRSDEFVELQLGRVSVSNPVRGPADAMRLLRTALAAVGHEDVAARVDRFNLPALLDGISGKIGSQLVALQYRPEVWERFDGSARRWLEDLVRAALTDATAETIDVDAVHVLMSVGLTASKYREERIRVRVDKDGKSLASIAYWRNHGNDYTKVAVELMAPSGVLYIKGDGVQDGRQVRFSGDVQVSIERPLVQLSGSVLFDSGVWQGQVQGQIRSEDPPLAVSVNLMTREGGFKGTADATLAIPDLLSVHSAQLILQEGQWSAEAKGTILLPEGRDASAVDFDIEADSLAGVKRFGFSSHSEIRLPLDDDLELLVRKGRYGRDGAVRMDNLAVVRKDAGRDKAIFTVGTLAFQLTRTGRELLETLTSMQPGSDPVALLAELVSRVELVEPVLVLRQPPRLARVTSETTEPDDQEILEKVEDVLGDRAPGKVPMDEGMRTALSTLVSRTTRQVEGLVQTAVRIGDAFPIDSVSIRDGRFEYSDAVSEQDRLLTDLSEFNAQIAKVTTPGTFQKKFVIQAGFTTQVGERQARSTLEAEVDLGTGDLNGSLEIERLALFPYRFFFPAMLAPAPSTRLEEARFGFQYLTESGLFSVWGKGRLREFNVISSRLTRRPMERLSADISLGEDPASGLRFDVFKQKMWTGSPILASFGKVRNLGTEFTVDALVPLWPKFSLRISLPDTPVQDLLQSLPTPLVSEIQDLPVRGSLGLAITAAGDSADLSGMTFQVTARDESVAVDGPGRKIDLAGLNRPFVHRPPTASARSISVGSGSQYVPLRQISPWLVLAVTTCEDGSFFRHEGFNTYQLKMSVIRNLEVGRFVRGASTLTMQLMKNLFLSHEKTVARKIQEVILTWLVEKEVPKERLVEMYLNVIEWGDGIYGIREACDHYFEGMPPSAIRPMQAAFLASFVPYPRPFHRRFDAGMRQGKRDGNWERWWEARLKLVRRVVKAMVENCSAVERKCPARIPFCAYLARLCVDSRTEFYPADHIKQLDEIFQWKSDAPLGDDHRYEEDEEPPVAQEL